ncbi:MAG TPA: J domain-containing protein [Bacteroidales bacterium]|nr:J domain-containing protein [Bacteroidales bacterium]
MTVPDYYKILGVPYDAASEEIKKAFKEKALQFHPDVYKGEHAGEIFQILNTAYHTLIDPARRRRYNLELKFPDSFTTKKEARYRHPADARYYARTEHHAPVYPKHYARNIRRLNRFMLFSIVAILSFGLVAGFIDMIRNFDFSGIIVWFISLGILFWGVRIIRHQKRSQH